MATTINKQLILNQLLEEASRLPEPMGTPLPVLEQFIYGLCREDATPEQADQAYKSIQKKFFDWNEIRVSSVREVEDALCGLSNAEGRAERLINFLQEVFETTFSFDLEALAKKGLKQAAKHITRYQAADEFIGSWVAQRTLGGHSIPLDVATLRTIRRLGLLDAEHENLEEGRAILEQEVPKARAFR